MSTIASFALIRAARAHGEHDERMGGEYDASWPTWYAAYMVAQQAATELPDVSTNNEARRLLLFSTDGYLVGG